MLFRFLEPMTNLEETSDAYEIQSSFYLSRAYLPYVSTPFPLRLAVESANKSDACICVKGI